jgi:hypothetical protein
MNARLAWFTWLVLMAATVPPSHRNGRKASSRSSTRAKPASCCSRSRAPSADEVIGTMIESVYTDAPAPTSYERALRRVSRRAIADTGDRAANAALVRDARNWLDKRIAPPKTNAVIQLPPGTPIGN